MGRSNIGYIIASRTDHGSCEKEDIFKHLGITNRDCDLIFHNLINMSAPYVVVRGRRADRAVAVLFVRSFAYDAGMSIAIELYDHPYSALSSVFGEALEGVVVSESAERLFQRESNKDNDRTEYSCVVESLRDMIILRNEFPEQREERTKAFLDMVSAAAAFIGLGLDVECDKKISNLECFSWIFSGRFCVAVLSILMMAARESSSDRRMSLCIETQEHITMLYASFKLLDEKNENEEFYFEPYLREVAESNGIPILFYVGEGRLFCRISPYYVDYSYASLKEPDIFPVPNKNGRIDIGRIKYVER